MATKLFCQSTVEEKLILSSIVSYFFLYFIGALYLVGSMTGYMVLSIIALRWYVRQMTSTVPVSAITGLWALSMLVLFVCLVVAHIDYDFGLVETIKSSIGWLKGWALMALFIFIGNILAINKDKFVRSCCILMIQAIPFFGVGVLLYIVGFNGQIYHSPLSALGGPGEIYQVKLFGINPETGLPRWQFFAPWAPAAGLMASLFFIICLEEKNRFWFFAGTIGCLTTILFCQSRAGWAIFFLLLGMHCFAKKALKIQYLLILGALVPLAIMVSEPVIEYMNDSYDAVKQSRPESSRVRDSLAEIAVQRWQQEAPIWGHGKVEDGPKAVEFMPIGSHHSWYGLLFVKGIVGMLAFAIPMAMTLIYFIILFLATKELSPLLIMLTLTIYSFFENLEILVYISWPAFLWLGMMLRRPIVFNYPYQERRYHYVQ